MLFISSGALTGHPDEHLQCIHIFIGQLLNSLYSNWPQIPWYGILLITVHLLSVLLILTSAFYKRDISLPVMLLFVLILLLGYEALFLVKLQFTSTAFIAGFAAVFCLLGRFGPRNKLTLFIFYITVAFLLRREVFLPVLCFAFLAFLEQYVRKQLSLRQTVLTVVAVSLLFASAWWVNDRDEAYIKSGYYAFHKSTDIICNTPLDTSGNIISKYGWSQNDLRLLGFWYWVDGQVFSSERIIAFAEEARSYRSIRETVQFGAEVLYEEKFAFLVIIFAVFFICFAVPEASARRFIWLNILFTTGIILYLIIMARVPKRVSTPILFYLAIVSLLVIMNSAAKPIFKLALMAILSVFCIYKFWCVFELSLLKKQAPPVFANSISHVNKHPEDLFIVVSKGFPTDLMPVLQRTNQLVVHHNLIFTGWLTRLPVFDRLLEINGLNDLCLDIVDKKNIVLVNGNIQLRKALATFYKEHYDVAASFTPYEPSFPNLPAYRILFERPDVIDSTSR
jgi:hypothetical protein